MADDRSFADESTTRAPLKVLIVDGQNNHEWKITTPIMKKYYEQCDRFVVDVATSPPEKHDMTGFRPQFHNYDVVVSNYNGDHWPKETEQEFQAFVYNGGGFVVVHAADNAFNGWPEYNEMIGLGGWGGRDERSGPYVYFRDGQIIRDDSKGSGGNHGHQHEFLVEHRDTEHPITRGLPPTWLHAKDELYEKMRGPAKNMHILATAFADPKQNGSGRHEPMLMTIEYGRGRVFHTTLGHADYSMRCVGFMTTLLRGTEWAATGEVTLAVPKDFPTASASSSRE
ncbi:MAG: ThuA domain-containing protein [Pirellulales bacterium]|nr:ThuA domain-containing protein [Pirellulales bacterium]